MSKCVGVAADGRCADGSGGGDDSVVVLIEHHCSDGGCGGTVVLFGAGGGAGAGASYLPVFAGDFGGGTFRGVASGGVFGDGTFCDPATVPGLLGIPHARPSFVSNLLSTKITVRRK